MSTLRRICRAWHEGRVKFSDHALEEMDRDQLALSDVRQALLRGRLHRTYENDPRGPRYVIRGKVNENEVDVVCRFWSLGMLGIITVYVVRETDE